MEKILKTRHVFIDTSIFVQMKFQWHSAYLQRLESLANSEKVYIHLTTVTIDEIKSGIRKALHNAATELKRFRKEATILSNITAPPFQTIFKRLNKEVAYETIKNAFEQFCKKAKVEILDVNSVSIDEIFSKYFNKKPPFGDGKKKSEFPDAFALMALENWCNQNSVNMYVISRDSDWTAACKESDYLISLTRLEEFIDLVSKQDEALSSFVISVFEQHEILIKKRIEDEFLEMVFWLEDQEGDIYDVNLDFFDIYDKYLINISDNMAVFELHSTFSFTTEVEYDDYETAVYDSEEKVAIPWRRIEKRVEKSIEIPIEITISFKESDPNYLEIEDIALNNGNDIGITVDEHPYYDLK